ncbi:MAG: phosphatase PAP2 family protein [Acidimicrobiia bacterium]|nr:phosphatase PAP2 family protein [Acidimicrobiia bacterium]
MPLVPEGLRARIARFDDRVDSAFDNVRGNPVSDRIFYGASELGDFSLVWFILGALRGLRSERDWHAAVRVGVGLGVESALVNGVIKSFFRRRRPRTEGWVPTRRLRRPRTSSFPSGHATSAFSAAALLSEDDALWPLYYAVAVVVASSRVYVKMHYASDVLAGAALGALMGRAARSLFPLAPAPSVTAVSESEVPGRG